MTGLRRYEADNFDEYLFHSSINGLDLCPATQYFLHCVVNRSGTFCPSPDAMLQKFDKRALKTLHELWHSFWTIMPVLYFLAIGYLIGKHFCALKSSMKNLIYRFVIEFVIVTLPAILCVNVFNYAVEYIVLVLTIGMCVVIFKAGILKCILAKDCYDLGGQRPHMLTLARASINLLTVLSILAVDFESFPKGFRKTRRFGAALMDTGIGLFVFAMGTVSKRMQNLRSLLSVFRQIVTVLLLGMARTIVILAINYHQDEHEYGKHLNAFFTLGLTKLFGSLLSATTKNSTQSFSLGMFILIVHELGLSLGVSDFVMNTNLERNTFFSANREGLCSLPGFIALYLMSLSMGHWLQTNEKKISGKQLLRMFGILFMCAIGCWMLVLLSLPLIGVARVTCNFGYVFWVLAIALTMTALYMFMFDMLLQDFRNIEEETVDILKSETKVQRIYKENTHVPILVEAINYNGLVYFLLANILTGQVNIFLKPEKRSTFESIFILFIYMFISSLVVFILFVKRIKIA